MNDLIDLYLEEGCGRCPLGGTPECKVHSWQKELQLLRKIVLSCGLTEELKWKIPCYTIDGRNVLTVSAFKEHATISFFKGALLKDQHRVLQKPGENSQAARVLHFTSVKAIRDLVPVIKETILDAIAVERSGQKVEFQAKHELTLPVELEQRLSELPALRAAWDGLTPGRQRGYVIFFSGAKQSATRQSRIEKSIPDILAGRGIHD